MPLPAIGLAAGSALMRGLGGLLNRRAQKKKEGQTRKSLVAGRAREEETRSARAGAGASLLRGVGSAPAYGGAISNPFASFSPEMLNALTRQQSAKELGAQITPAELEAAAGRPATSALGGGLTEIGGLLTGMSAGQDMGGGPLQGVPGSEGGLSGSFGGVPTTVNWEDIIRRAHGG